MSDRASGSSDLRGQAEHGCGLPGGLPVVAHWIMLFDVSTSAREPELVGAVLEVIRQVPGVGMTMLVAPHEMVFANEADDTVAFVNEGGFVVRGKLGDICQSPKHPRTREFLSRMLNRWCVGSDWFPTNGNVVPASIHLADLRNPGPFL